MTGLDQSAQMLEIARERIPGGHVVQGDAVPLPFEDGNFDRVFTGDFYGHLRGGERERFVAESARVARQLSRSTRTCGRSRRRGGSRSERSSMAPRTGVNKRYFTGAGLAAGGRRRGAARRRMVRDGVGQRA